MAYCSQCGVEVEERAERCPLCQAPIQRLDEPKAEAPHYPEVPVLPGRQVRYLVWLVSTAVLLSAALTCIAINLVHDQGISWSRYPTTGAGVLWLFITLVVIFARRPIFVIVGQAVATAGFLALIDLFDGHLDWFVPLALPIVAVVSGASLLVWMVARLSRRAPALTAASVLLSCALASVGLDLLISAQLGAVGLGWSFIVLAAVVPPTAFLVYFHIRLSGRMDFARILHR
jgi:hypothetical protein